MPHRLDIYLDAAIQDPSEPDMLVMPDYLADWGRDVYAVLTALTRKAGTAALILDAIPDKNGWTAWRRLVQEYQPQERDRQVAVYSSLLNPTWSEDLDKWYPEWLQWESQWSRYSMETRKPMDDEARVATLLRWAPPKLQEFFKVSPDTITQSYKALHAAVTAYLARTRVYPGGVTATATETGRSSQAEADVTPANPQVEQKQEQEQPSVDAVTSEETISVVSGPKGKGKGRLLRQKDERIMELEKQVETLRAQIARLTGTGDDGDPGTVLRRRFANLRPGSCYRCGQPGHRAFECDEDISMLEEVVAGFTLESDRDEVEGEERGEGDERAKKDQTVWNSI